jgi:hypothetical protein
MKADMLKVYEEKMMADQKADQEREEVYEKMMVERETDQEKRESERKAHQEDLQKMMKEMMDANQTKKTTIKKEWT